MFGNLSEIFEDIFNPSGVFSEDFETYSLWLASPVIDVLTKEAHFWSYWRNSKSGQNIVVLIAPHFVAYDLVRITFHDTIWEWSVLGNVLEYLEIAWGSTFYVIWFSAVEWPNELIARSMAIKNKL